MSSMTRLLYFLFLQWSLTVLSHECGHGVDIKRLLPLVSYVNDLPGLFHDHFTTTWTQESHASALRRYTRVEQLGLVLASNHQDCECTVEILQLFEENPGLGGTLPDRPGLFGRLNHKLMLKSQRPEEVIDSYLMTGERFYCAPKFGQCGASVPLKEWHMDAEDDTIYTTNLTLRNTLGVSNKGVICYIWPLNYKSESLAPSRRVAEIEELIPVNGKAREVTNVVVGGCKRLETENGDWILSSLIPSVGTKATLTCLPNFWPNGTKTSVCQGSGRWLPSPSSSHCVCTGCSPFSLENRLGQIAYKVETVMPLEHSIERKLYSVGTTAAVVCPDKTEVGLRSADISACTNEGWVPAELGNCERVCSPLSLFNGLVVYTDNQGFDQPTLTNGTIATGVCNENARLLNGSGMSLCVEGEWSTEELGTCHLPTCPPIENVGDGRLLQLRHQNMTSKLPEIFYSGTTIRLQCKHEKKIVGAPESKCDPSGVWQPNLGKCE